MKKKGTITLKQMEKAYQEVKVFNDDWIEKTIIPRWKAWLYRLMPWKYKKINKGTFLVIE